MIRRVDARFSAAEERVHAGVELGEGEGLHEIIVGAAFESLDPIADRGQCGKDEDGRFNMRGAKRPKHGQAVQDWKHPVENDEVEAAASGAEQAILTVRRLLDAVPFLGEPLGKVRGSLAIILDQQDLAAHSGQLPNRFNGRI